MLHAPNGTRRTTQNQGWCRNCGQPLVLIGNDWYVLPNASTTCTVGANAGQPHDGDATMCPVCETVDGLIGCPVCEENDELHPCGVCNSNYLVPCPVCRPAQYARRVARAKRPAEWATAPTVPTADIDSIPAYRRWLAGEHDRLRAEMETAYSSALSLDTLSGTVHAGLDKLAALDVDAATAAEGQAVLEGALAAVRAARELLDTLGHLAYTIHAAHGGAARHDVAQELHDSDQLAHKTAYCGN